MLRKLDGTDVIKPKLINQSKIFGRIIPFGPVKK